MLGRVLAHYGIRLGFYAFVFGVIGDDGPYNGNDNCDDQHGQYQVGCSPTVAKEYIPNENW